MISPGPCTPNEAGISVDLVKEFGEHISILGVCLGHQSIAQAFGGVIVRARQLMHGKTSMILHQGEGLFGGVPSPFQATRYHSLVVQEASCRIVLKLRHGPMMTKSWVYGTRIGHSRGFSFIPNPYSPSMATSNCRIFLTALSHGKATRRYSGTHT